MKRLAAILALSASLAAAGPASASDSAPGLAAAAGSRFPDRAFALTLPDARAVRPDQVVVHENGALVRGVSVRSALDTPASRFAVVLAIDTSWSMHGRPLAGAIDAAREFVRYRSPSQPVALMTFDGAVRLVQPFTTDTTVLQRALASIRRGGGGSRVLDAGRQAIALLQASHARAGSVILLTDGADRGSHTAQDAVGAAAKAAGVRVFTVGLHSGSADFGTLNLLAASTAGEFSAAASVQDLARVYQRLGARLAHQYLIQYRSSAAPHSTVDVEVRVAGVPGGAHATYVTPALDRAVRAPFSRAPAERLWASPAWMIGASAFVAGLIALAIWIIVRPRRGSVRRRLAEYVSVDPGRPDRLTSLTGRARALAASSKARGRAAWWASLEERFDIGRVPMSPERALAWTGVATLATLALATLTVGPLGILAAPFVPVAAHLLLARRVAKQRKLFADQLPDNLQVIASAMRAGHSFAGALQVVVEDAPEPARSELQRVIADERLGVPLEEAFGTVVRRMESKDLEQVALVAALQRETGGNTAEVIDRVNDTMRERTALRRLVNSLTAQGRMSRWVLTAIPVVLLVLLTSINPDYMRPLYTTPIGRALLIVAGLMVVSGSMVIKRIVNIKV